MEPIEILYLEDSEYDAEMVTRILKKAGMNFFLKIVDTQDEYTNALNEHRPDVILSDHSILQFNSFDALRIFKTYDFKIPFILITGTVSEEFAVNILKEGADDYLLKENLIRLPSAINKAIREKKVEREKDDAFNNMQILFKNIDEVFFSIDKVNNKLIQISDGCLSVYGYPPEKFHEELDTWHKVIHPEDKENIQLNDSRLKLGETVYREYRIIRPDKVTCWVGTKIIPTLDETGNLIRLDGTTLEITRRKNAENDLKMKCHDLSTLIYRLAHDIKGPIATTAGLINLAKLDISDSSALKYIDMMEESNNRLDKITSGMMELIKIDSKENQNTEIDFSKLVENIMSLFKNRLETKDVKSTLKIEVQNSFYCDEQLIYSLLYNLISNSMQYRNNIKPSVNIFIQEESAFIKIQVEDNGIGIGKEHQSKVFDIFYRANEKAKGSGLGLYIVKSIVEKLKGKIELESLDQSGTTFTILLPK